jgi:GNAT superfamily N-acetyltransferase
VTAPHGLRGPVGTLLRVSPSPSSPQSAPVVVSPVSGKRELREFILLPFRLYEGVPQWVPPLISERKRHLDRTRNPYFQHADAEYFLARRGDRIVGRISAQIDRHFNEVQENDWGQFGFFECEDDPEAASALVDTARVWLSDRGRDHMIGPLDFSTNDECGLLVEGHQRAPQILEGWHHPYYADLLEGCGLEKAMDLYKWSLHVSGRENVLPVIFELADKLEPEHGITIRGMRRRDMAAEVGRFMEIYNASWERNWGFVPLTDAEIEHYASELKPILDENWAMVAETREGETVGVALTLPDYNQVLKKLNGRLLPFGWVRALREKRKIDAVRVFALGVKPEYQHTGVAAGLYARHFEMAAKTPQGGGEMGWILEVNKPMNKAMEAMGGKIVKRYRIYGGDLPPAPASAAPTVAG